MDEKSEGEIAGLRVTNCESVRAALPRPVRKGYAFPLRSTK